MRRQSRIYVSAALGASLFVLAGAGAVALTDDGFAEPLITDIRVGERGQQTRIALFCAALCDPQPRGDGAFFLPGAADAFQLDISDAGARVSSLESVAMSGGSALIVGYEGALANSKAGPCVVGGRQAACLDLYFLEQDSADIGVEIGTGIAIDAVLQDASADASPPPAVEPRPAESDEPAETTTANSPGRVAAMSKPALREAAGERLTVFANLAAPERLSPPILAKVQPIEKSVTVGTPTLRPSESLAVKVERDFAGRIENLLGKPLTPAYCNNAEATLQTDAWALGAMVDVGLCAGARGDAIEAESILSRLLEYAPDNYQALVGKAIIAELAGERGAALRFYQDALNVPPPVRESARIVEAMAAIS